MGYGAWCQEKEELFRSDPCSPMPRWTLSSGTHLILGQGWWKEKQTCAMNFSWWVSCTLVELKHPSTKPGLVCGITFRKSSLSAPQLPPNSICQVFECQLVTESVGRAWLHSRAITSTAINCSHYCGLCDRRKSSLLKPVFVHLGLQPGVCSGYVWNGKAHSLGKLS